MLSDYALVAFASAVLGAALRPVFDDIHTHIKNAARTKIKAVDRQQHIYYIPIYGQWKRRQRQQEIEELVEATYAETELDDDN